METYRIHEHSTGQCGTGAVTNGVPVKREPQPAVETAFEGRLMRLAHLTRAAGEQTRRLDACVMRLSGMSPPRGKDGGDAAEPSNVLAKFDAVLEHLDYLISENGEHLNRLETL